LRDCDSPLPGMTRQCCAQGRWRQAKRRQHLFPREVGAALGQAVIQIAGESGHSRIIFNILLIVQVFEYESGSHFPISAPATALRLVKWRKQANSASP